MEALTLISPAGLSAVHVYMPLSVGLAFIIRKAFSSLNTCRRRSVAAGKSLPPNFCKAISGIGSPVAEHTRRAVSPESMVKLEGICKNEG